MKDWLLLHAISVVLKFAIGPITYLIGRYVLNAWHWLDDLPPFAKRLIIFGLAIALSAVFQALGQPLPPECSAIATGDVPDACVTALSSNPVLAGIIGALVALFIHAKKKEPPNA